MERPVAHPVLMAVLCDVHHHCLFPAEEEVPGARSCSHGNAQVPVVGHEDQHEEVADHHLDDVQHSLKQVGQAQHLLAGNTNPNKSANGTGGKCTSPKRKLPGQQGGRGMAQKVTPAWAGTPVCAGTWSCGFVTKQNKHGACWEDTTFS